MEPHNVTPETVFESSAFMLGAPTEEAKAFIDAQVVRLEASGTEILSRTQNAVRFRISIRDAVKNGWTAAAITDALLANRIIPFDCVEDLLAAREIAESVVAQCRSMNRSRPVRRV